MDIKITGCRKPKSWYRERIGEAFRVLEESIDMDGKKIYIVHKGKITNSYVEAKDCCIVSQETINLSNRT